MKMTQLLAKKRKKLKNKKKNKRKNRKNRKNQILKEKILHIKQKQLKMNYRKIQK